MRMVGWSDRHQLPSVYVDGVPISTWFVNLIQILSFPSMSAPRNDQNYQNCYNSYLSQSFAKQYTLQSTMPKERLSWKDTNLALSEFDGLKTKLCMVIII